MPNKRDRVARFHAAMIQSFLEPLGAMAASYPRAASMHLIHRRISDSQNKRLAEIYQTLEPGSLLEGGSSPPAWAQAWAQAWDLERAETFAPRTRLGTNS